MAELAWLLSLLGLGAAIPAFLAGQALRMKRRLEEQLSEKIEELENMEYLNQTLISKQRMCNDELQDARKEAIRVLIHELNGRTTLRIKKMGEVDVRPFKKLSTRKRSVGDREEMSAVLRSSWQAAVRDPHWHPFKKVIIKGNLKEVIDEDDEKLKTLRSEHSEEAFEAVVNALMELNEYNPSGRYIMAEIWNPEEGRKATMKEIIQYLDKPRRRKRRT